MKRRRWPGWLRVRVAEIGFGARQQRWLVAVGVIVAVGIGTVALRTSLSADSSRPGTAQASPTPSRSVAPVIVPGRPGESASVRPGDQVRADDGALYNVFDVAFIRMMIPHHVQAVEMAALAPTRGRNPQLLAVADRIKAAQVPEIARMRAWLQARGLSEADRVHPDHGSMRGMQSPEAMRTLAGASGEEFDRLFERMMIEHHQGAIDMATNLLKVGSNVEVGEIATGVAAEQTAEINRIRDATS